MINLNLHPSSRFLRQFGLFCFVGFGFLAGLIFTRRGLFGIDFGDASQPVAIVLFAVGAASGFLSWIAPRANRPLYLLLLFATYPMGFILSHVVLGLIFYGMLTPFSFVFKLMGRDVLNRRFDRSAESYWIRHKPITDLKRYFRQF
jgi:hypothetical protein